MDSDLQGWIYKWTNYISGYQKRWFVLHNALLSYYRSQAEMGYTCRGTINVVNAMVYTEDSCSFVISNGDAVTFYLKASSDVEREKWVTALESAKSEAIMHTDDEEEEESDDQSREKTFDSTEIESSIKILNKKIADLTTCNNLIVNHGTQLQSSLAELDQIQSAGDATSKMKAINERATLFRVSANAMINASQEYLNFIVTQRRRLQNTLKKERDERLALQSMVEHLAKQHSSLEHRARSLVESAEGGSACPQTIHGNTDIHSEDEEDFEDAMDQFTVVISTEPGTQAMKSPVSGDNLGFHRQDGGFDSEGKGESSSTDINILAEGKNISANCTQRIRRKTIPERPNYGLVNLWSILRDCVGKDLTKIPMPINFNEPLSLLQRLSENFEYSDCLDNAARCDQWEQMCWVAAFTISSYCSTTSRINKPFNPLLGETFECDRREDLGWKLFAEQVTHHPPSCAIHTAGNMGWTVEQEVTVSSKFRGKYMQIIPLGIAHCKFEGSGNHYTWRKVTTTVHNIIVGKLWVDNHGEMDIVNHKTGDKCHLKFSAYSYFSKDIPRKVTGVVTDKQGTARWVLRGTWDDKMEAAKVLGTSQHGSKPVFETGEYKVVWKKRPPPAHLEKCYNMTQLGVELNENEDGVAPTDSRHRPDQRLMENTLWDEANKEKQRLEEKQRAARRLREKEAELATAEGRSFREYQPVWFRKTQDPITGKPIHLFTNEYWDCKALQDFSRCPDIF